ncbi:Starch-binding associating with outer membrane [Mucilaginibacter pineti]|uniref:Starch-binding associating with outer membrane n=1 Tax=Mucilaginibacter pineti TaxID=1391627 RepID=A0A1G7D9E8_9SPHI|nr:RagB/SusD family nutrient uptake outer membrane protein [Mucilaginibacter pineti]SDE48172.1 Starch-binding associating with outer membrane [Mucilaginibacter pineti]
MYKKIYIAILALSIVSGCKKSPLNVAPTDKYSTNAYPQSIADLNSVLAAGYSNLRDQNYLGFNFLPKALSNSMHTVNSMYGGDAGWNEMANTNLSITNSFSTGAWKTLFTGVKNCNTTIAAVAFFNAHYAKATDKADADAILGQAYFLRGYYYMQLETLFGESYISAGGAGGDKLGVPIYDVSPTDLAGTQKARSSVKEVWDLIENDLKKSADLLKGKVWTGNDIGRVTEWSAKGQLGKAYVYTQDWTNAKTTLLDVIQHSGKSLMPFSKYSDAFGGNTANEFNEESLFELNIDNDSKGGYGIYSDAANATAINGLIWAPWALGGDGKVENAFALGYGNEFMHDQNVLRFGYPLGTAYNLVNNPKYTGKDPSYANPEKIMDPAYKTQAALVRTAKTADPRLYVNGIQPWLDSLKFDGVHWAPAAKPNGLANNTDVYGWSVRKYAPTLYNEGNGNGNAPTNSIADAWNFYLLRLADVYLLYAEAAKGSGDVGTALEYLNKVKRRAYNLPIDAASPIDYKSLTDKTSAINDPVLGNNPLYYERWAELFNEGSWWFDVCRWRIGKSEATYYKTAMNLSGNFQWDDSKSYVWPIPLDEINSNGKIVQSAGYK